MLWKYAITEGRDKSYLSSLHWEGEGKSTVLPKPMLWGDRWCIRTKLTIPTKKMLSTYQVNIFRKYWWGRKNKRKILLISMNIIHLLLMFCEAWELSTQRKLLFLYILDILPTEARLTRLWQDSWRTSCQWARFTVSNWNFSEGHRHT